MFSHNFPSKINENLYLPHYNQQTMWRIFRFSNLSDRQMEEDWINFPRYFWTNEKLVLVKILFSRHQRRNLLMKSDGDCWKIFLRKLAFRGNQNSCRVFKSLIQCLCITTIWSMTIAKGNVHGLRQEESSLTRTREGNWQLFWPQNVAEE